MMGLSNVIAESSVTPRGLTACFESERSLIVWTD